MNCTWTERQLYVAIIINTIFDNLQYSLFVNTEYMIFPLLYKHFSLPFPLPLVTVCNLIFNNAFRLILSSPKMVSLLFYISQMFITSRALRKINALWFTYGNLAVSENEARDNEFRDVENSLNADIFRD